MTRVEFEIEALREKLSDYATEEREALRVLVHDFSWIIDQLTQRTMKRKRAHRMKNNMLESFRNRYIAHRMTHE